MAIWRHKLPALTHQSEKGVPHGEDFGSEWTSAAPMGKLVRHVAFGYTLAVNGKRERKFSSPDLSRGCAEGAERTVTADSSRTDRSRS